MASSETRIRLSPALFGEKEKTFVEAGPLSASLFRYSTGVCAVRIQNELGALVMLPYQGQQIWSADFGGRSLTMKSMFPEPRPNRSYLQTYGAFFLHCGFTAMGVPGKGDTHPQHGELPNVAYDEACVVVGSDSRGAYIAVGGEYRHTAAFHCNYVARPLVKLYAGSSRFPVSMTVNNLRAADLEYMYLAHIDYRPVDNGRLVYSAPNTPDRVKVRKSLPPGLVTPPGYIEFLEAIERDPACHTVLKPELPFSPEVVLTLAYSADETGWAHSLHVLPDGRADYVGHRPDQLDKVVRWIARIGDHDALGFAMPATAEPEGYTAEKAKGNVKVLPGLAEWRVDLELGALDAAEAAEIERKIRRILGGN